MNKLLSAILLSLTLGLLPWRAGNANAADFAVPHTFQGGGVVSADELNENFAALNKMFSDFVDADFVGTWSCPVSLTNGVSYSGWTISADGLTQNTTVTLTFTLTSGTLYYSSSSSPFSSTNNTLGCKTCDLTNVPVKVTNGILMSGIGSSYPYSWSIKKRTMNRFEFGGLPSSPVCDKQNVLLKPSGLTASASGTSITLTWTDNSTNETSFDIVRKDSVSGTYAVVGNVTANTVTYTNTSVPTGTHWYRVIAKNANGSSLGSNVVKVTN